MSITIPNTTLGPGVIDSGDLEANFTALTNKFGNIDNSDILSTAAIAPTKLSAYYSEAFVQLPYHFGAGGAWPAVGATTPLLAVPVPAISTDPSWVATHVTWVCSDIGTADGSFDVRYGAYDGTGVWNNSGSIATGVTLTRAGGDNTGFQGRSSGSYLAVTIPAVVSVGGSDRVTCIALMSAGAGTNVITQGFLTVTVRLRRTIQSF